MKNVFRVLKRDILRLLKVPPAMVVIIALLVLPSLYTWYNVLGFWDPYESTGHLHVCVVNEDEGADSELTGHIDVGAMIVDELHGNDQLDWQFVSYDEAMDQVKSGQSYAAFVIPKDFSAKLLTLTTGHFEKPDIDYYVNEKIGPIAPKITDTGANTLDATVNATFVETVSLKATEALNAALAQSDERMDNAKSLASAKVEEAKDRLEGAASSIAALADQARQAKDRAEAAKSSLATARDAIDNASGAMDSLSDVASTLQGDYMGFVANTVPLVTDAMKDAADAYAEAARVIGDLPVQSDEARELLDRLRASADDANAQADLYARILADDIAPVLGERLGALAGATSKAAGSIAGQKLIIAQAQTVIDEMVATLDSVAASLDQTRALLEGLVGEVDRVHTDAMMLAGSEALSNFIGEDGLDAQKVSEFISAPTRLETVQLYPVVTYGTAMAPLFMNLTFWIGAFMLMVVLRQEVDASGIRKLTLTQRYLGRFLLYAILVVLQAVICCAGLPFIGMHVVNLPALFFASIVASLSYLSIICALSVTLQHLGKGICIILVFMQIPAATGLYPIEMTSPFFQAIYPLFPFTYGISAMREAICGFYGLHYLRDICILLAFLIVFMAIGILARPWLSNVNRMVAREIKQSGIFNGESVEVPVRRFRFSQVLRALADRDEYRKALMRRYARFQQVYPRLIRGAIIAGIAVPVIVLVVFSLGMTGKVVLLTLFLGWIALVFCFLIVVESLRSSFTRQLRLDKMSDEQLRDLYLSRNGTEQADNVHGLTTLPDDGDGDGEEDEDADEDAAAPPAQDGRYSAKGGDRDA
ncbi:MAG: YhgE/Pip domain-containing protein [Coriobacteriales bacterium]